VQEKENFIQERLGTLAFHLKDLKSVIDHTTDGLWIDEPADNQGKRILDSMATKHIALSQRFDFNSRQTADLVNEIFATSPDVQAQAKLNLSARLEKAVFDEVIQYPDRTLDLVATEVQLTQEEILYIVFP
jgi:hypothetical protein